MTQIELDYFSSIVKNLPKITYSLERMTNYLERMVKLKALELKVNHPVLNHPVLIQSIDNI